MAVLGFLGALAIGCSLIVLEQHMLSDVIGGYLLATMWAALRSCGAARRGPALARPRRLIAHERRLRIGPLTCLTNHIAARSARAIVGALVLPRGAAGITEASMTAQARAGRRRTTARSTTAFGSSPIRQVPTGW